MRNNSYNVRSPFRFPRSMRSHPTDIEKAMWWRLRNRNLGGFKFRRQRPIGRHVADFVCREARLVVELDGAQHDAQTDRVRSNDLKELGYDVIQFTNKAVRKDIDAVCDQILVPLHSGFDRLDLRWLQRGQEGVMDEDSDTPRHPWAP